MKHIWIPMGSIVAVLALSGLARASIVTAGAILVDLDARHPTAGTSNWHNMGTLGNFTEGGDPTVAALGPSGSLGVSFDGISDYYRCTDLAPASLTGNSGRSIEVWVYNPSLSNEETMVSWGRFGGPAGTNMSFGYGTQAERGAVVHWLADLGWEGAPAAGEWHYLAYTYDGTDARIYADGDLKNSMNISHLNTVENTPITLAAQTQADGVGVLGFLRGSLSIANLRIHNSALGPADIAHNYLDDAERFRRVPAVPAPGAVALAGFGVGLLGYLRRRMLCPS